MGALLRQLYGLPYVLLTLTSLFWAGNTVLARAVRDDVPPIGLAFWRWVGAFLIVLGMAWPHLKRDWPVAIKHWRFLLLLSLLSIASYNTLTYVALHWTTAINGSLLQSLMPVAIVVMSYVMFRETVTPLQGLGVAISLAGAVAIVARGDLDFLTRLSVNRGDVLFIVAVVLYAAYAVLLRKRPPLHPMSFLAVIFAAGAVMLVPVYAWEIGSGSVMRLDRVTLLAVAYVAVFPSILSYLFFNRGVELVGANRGGLFVHLIPVFGSLMAILFLGERFELFHAVGMALILGGIALANRAARRPT